MGMKSLLLGRAARALVDRAKSTVDADRLLQLTMTGLIEARRAEHESHGGERYRAGDPLKLLFAGYVGSRNTGADVRTEEMLRQFRHLFGDEHLDLSIFTIDPEWTRGYFRTAKQLHVPQVFPKFLFDTIKNQHGVVACEGSMFKSKFASALTTMMVGSLGLATAEEKLAIAYGGEAGAMDESLETMVERYIPDACVITRNPESSTVLARLGVSSRSGTDTAWTFGGEQRGEPRVIAEKLLRRAGWNGEDPILILSPIHPFWWPVKPDPWKAVAHNLSGAHARSHYRSIYFHNDAPEVEKRFDQYIKAFAGAALDLTRERKLFPIILGMEALDRLACERFAEEVHAKTHRDWPVFVSDQHDMFEMVALLRSASALVSSRYHALVCSMPAGVPSVGVTMDERIRNLMKDRGTPELSLECDDRQLDERIVTETLRVLDDAPRYRDGIERTVAQNLVRMGQMGQWVVDYVREREPRFPLRRGLGSEGDPLAHLPPLPRLQTRILERHHSTAASPSSLGAPS